MDNRINEIRRKISALRLEMADLEATVRNGINDDRDCTDAILAQMDLRRKINLLIEEWRAAGGGDVLPDVRNRVRLGIGHPRRGIAALKAARGAPRA